MMTRMTGPRSLLFVVLPGAKLLDVIGPMEAFEIANRLRLRRYVASRRPHTLVIGGSIDLVRSRFPEARVETDALYTHDGRIYTSAGVTTGIDLALYLIERDLGSAMALAVARLLVVFPPPAGRSVAVQRVAPAARWRGPADAATRTFRGDTGMTPAAFVERVRIDAARSALELTDRTVGFIARRVRLRHRRDDAARLPARARRLTRRLPRAVPSPAHPLAWP